MFIFVFNSVFAENTAALVIKAASRVFKIRNGGKYMDRLAKAMERYKDSANYFASHKFVTNINITAIHTAFNTMPSTHHPVTGLIYNIILAGRNINTSA